MLLRPGISCRQPQYIHTYRHRPIVLPTHLISTTPAYLLIRTYTSPRSYQSKPRFALQRSPPASVTLLNPPSTTHPPPLNLPEKVPDLPKHRYYFRVGKAYALFYKTGLKAIWTNYKLARALPDHIFSKNETKVHQAVYDGVLSRADFQLIRRTRHDINKVPLFALIWLVCGEFTPLVVIFFTGAVPRTLWIPKQAQKAREQAENRRAKSKEENALLLTGPLQQSDVESMPEETQRRILKSHAQSLGLYPAWWDLWPTLIPITLIKRRVYRNLGELEVDDFAIERDGGVGRLEGEEVRIACEERGISILGKEESHLRRDLEQWMERRADGKHKPADEKIRHSIGVGK